MTPVEIKWIDAEGLNQWMSTTELEDWADRPFVALTRGFLVYETEDYYVISATVSPESDRYTTSIRIPKLAVLNFEKI